jgi:hypothetical protein
LPIRSSRVYAFLLTTRLRVFTSGTNAGTTSSSPAGATGSDAVGLRLGRTEATGAREGGGAPDTLGDVDFGLAGASGCGCGGGMLPAAERRVSDSWH